MAFGSTSIGTWALLAGISLWEKVPSASEELKSDAHSALPWDGIVRWHESLLLSFTKC